MTRLSPRLVAGFVLGLCLMALPGRALRPDAPSDDCDSRFIAFIGSDGYQFSPLHEGELGSLRLFSILSYPRAAAAQDFGRALWRVQIFPAEGRVAVFTGRGTADLRDARGAVLVEHFWDGRDDAGRLVPPGTYRFSFEARYLPDSSRYAGRAQQYEDLAGVPGMDEAFASSDEIVIDLGLSRERAEELRESAALTACQVQQHAPLEAGFGYSFYYGSTHAHSNYSDGGQATSSCSSGKAYGSGSFDPAAVYNYARNTAGLDFWLINEHNHLINDSVATNNGPVTEAKVRQRYQNGLAAASTATVNDAFVALYGMEWGVLTNSNQGHVTLIETPKLFGWESCSSCNGPNAECTAGSNCYFDVFTPKRYGYLTLYKRSVENPSPAGALGILAHPSSGHFDGFAFNADADQALQGIAVRSGLAFTAAENCADANVASSDYSARWRDALNRGFHLGPTADHDSHCNNFGQGLPTRTVYLLPNGSSPVLTKTALLQAHKARHFFATEDPNAQLVFASSSGRVMGDIFGASSGTTLRAAVYDPNGDTVSVLELWRGQIGAGVPASAYRTFSNQASFSVAENLTSGTYYYYVHARQADGHDLWSAPMWVTYSAGGDTQAPSTSITAPAGGATVVGSVSVTASASDNVGVTSVEFYLDGALKSIDASSPYSWSWDTTSGSNGAHGLSSKAYDAAGNVGTSAAVSVTVNNPTSTDVSSFRLVQANSSVTYLLPAGTLVPAGGYVIVARDASKTAFEAFWRGGTALPSNVVYVNSGGALPLINGSENYTLYNPSGTKLDGATVSMASGAGQSLRRIDPCNAPGATASWTIGASSGATPGSGAGAGCAKGLVINEFSDATGTGNFVYEFVELHNDR